MDETDRLRRRARVLSAVVTALWAVLLLGFVGLTVALQYTDSADDDRAAGIAEFVTGFDAMVALLPALLWLTVTVAYRRGRRWAAPFGVVVAAVTGMCSVLLVPFTLFADWGGYLIAFVLLLNGLGVVAVTSMVSIRTPLPTSSVPQSG